MGVVIRQSFWSSAFTYFGLILGYFNSLILFPYFLEVDLIGLIRLVQSNGVLLVPVLGLGVNGAYMKYYPKFSESKDSHQLFFSFIFRIILISCAVGSGILLLLRNELSGLYDNAGNGELKFIIMTIVVGVSKSFFNLGMSTYWSRHKTIYPTILNEIVLRLLSMGIITLYGFKFINFTETIVLIGLSYSIISIILLFPLFWKEEFRLKLFARLPKAWSSKILSFALYTMAISLFTATLLNVSYPIVSDRLGLEATGIFTIGMYICSVIISPKGPVIQIVSPLIANAFHNNDLKSIQINIKKASINLGILGVLIAIGILSNIESLFAIVPKGDTLRMGVTTIQIITIAKLIEMLSGVNGVVINYSSFKSLNFVVEASSALILILSSILLIPQFGLAGAGLAILTSTLISNIIRISIIYTRLKFVPLYAEHIKILILGIILYSLTPILPKFDNQYLHIISNSLIIVGAFLPLLYFLKISEDMNRLIDLAITKLVELFR